jgi:cytochrome c peroxidase
LPLSSPCFLQTWQRKYQRSQAQRNTLATISCIITPAAFAQIKLLQAELAQANGKINQLEDHLEQRDNSDELFAASLSAAKAELGAAKLTITKLSKEKDVSCTKCNS